MILVSSIAGFKESTGLATYTASKHGVLGLLRGVRIQAGREGVRVNAVCPWMTSEFMFLFRVCLRDFYICLSVVRWEE